VVVLAAALAVVQPLYGRAAASSLHLNGTFAATAKTVACPAGTPASTICVDTTGNGALPGLGQASETFSEMLTGSATCMHTTFGPAAIQVTGKGELDATLTDPETCDPQLGSTATAAFTITGGTGPYAGATGNGTFTFTDFHSTGPTTATETHAWTGQIAAATDFDTTAPAITRAKPVVARTRKRATRVRFTLTATDTADGPVPVTCHPKSGASFSVGRTRVRCSATDSSDNTATASFTVTVKHIR
jgi:HYR domain-containing protein